jgi:hypothetical protein
VVESTALEMRRTGNRTGGSNPPLSAISPIHHQQPSAALAVASAALWRHLAFISIAGGTIASHQLVNLCVGNAFWGLGIERSEGPFRRARRCDRAAQAGKFPFE